MLKSILPVVAFVVLFAACKKEELVEPTTTFLSDAELAEITDNTCSTVIPDDMDYTIEDTPPTSGVEDRATGMKNKFWTPGSTLKVKFLNGTTTLQNQVMQYAEQWEQFANINFVKVTTGTSHIRVNFSSEGHWSYVGTDNNLIAQTLKTMNLALTGSSTEEQVRRVVLHEFGHALGLGHEHQNPLASIPWNIPAVYAYYATQGWSQQKVNEQILNKFTWAQTQHTNPDLQSIMQYSVSSSLTTNGSSIPWNTVLSATDKNFIQRIYSSQKIKVRHAVSNTGTITFWLNGIYHTIQPGESMWVPAYTSGNQLSIWECPNGNSSCTWDAYAPPYGYNYKIVAQGSNINFKLVYD